MKKVCASVRIKGRVQGVFYRQSTKETASLLGVTGWVRNLPNGDVEAVIEGPEGAVKRAIDWCNQGPPAARVEEVLVEWLATDGNFTEFSIR